MTEKDLVIQGLRRENEALRAELEWTGKEIVRLRSRLKMQWIPCSERLPEDEETVLTYKNGRFEVQEYEKRRNGWISIGWFWSLATVTHWMPLPEPPKEVNDGNKTDL